jgi:hypothetical protein
LFDDYEESNVEGHEHIFLLSSVNIEQQIQHFFKPEYDIFQPEIEESQQEQISHGSQIKECIDTCPSRYGSHVFTDLVAVYMKSNWIK